MRWPSWTDQYEDIEDKRYAKIKDSIKATERLKKLLSIKIKSKTRKAKETDGKQTKEGRR